MGGKEKTTLKEMSELLGKETIDSFNTSETRGRELSHGLNYQKLGKELRGIYENTREGNGQKWLMIDLEGRDELYHDVFLLLKIRRGEAGKR